jgi:hypothetical protein
MKKKVYDYMIKNHAGEIVAGSNTLSVARIVLGVYPDHYLEYSPKALIKYLADKGEATSYLGAQHNDS